MGRVSRPRKAADASSNCASSRYEGSPCRPVARKPCRASVIAPPLHEAKKTPGEAPGVEGGLAFGERAAIYGRDKVPSKILFLAPQARAQRPRRAHKVPIFKTA